jgi:hypothetical protein
VIAVLAVALTLGGTLPQGAVRYRVELGGVAIGRAELSVGCAGASCMVRWESRLRLPAESGGAVARRLVSVAVGRDGVYRGGALEVDDGRPARAALAPTGVGFVPATAAELLLAAGARGCLEAFEEGSGVRGRACAASERGPSGALRLGVLGDVLEVRGLPGALPREVAIPAQGVRFVADPGARVPDAPPAIAGTEVPGPGSPEGAAPVLRRGGGCRVAAGARRGATRRRGRRELPREDRGLARRRAPRGSRGADRGRRGLGRRGVRVARVGGGARRGAMGSRRSVVRAAARARPALHGGAVLGS